MGKHTIRAGGWRILGNLPLAGALAEYQAYRNQPVGSNQLYIYRAGQFTPAGVDDVRHLEAFAFWFPAHIVERLQDHFAGRPNRTFEFFKRIKKYDLQTGQEIGSGSTSQGGSADESGAWGTGIFCNDDATDWMSLPKACEDESVLEAALHLPKSMVTSIKP